MRGVPAAALLTVLVAGTACRQSQGETTARSDSIELARREAHVARALAGPDSGTATGTAIARWVLTGDLTEISGLALTADGRLLTHGDERGRVFEIDYRHGVIVKQFMLGTPPALGDFEGITTVHDTVYLLTSKGKLYQFQEGANGEHVAFTIHDTGLRNECEFEGLAFDPAIQSLLFACKVVHTKGLIRDSLVIYRWRLPAGSQPPSRLTLPLVRVIGTNGWSGVHPSDITIDPISGNYVLVAGEESALIEITPAGALVFARRLPAGIAHAEGVAITKDSILIVGNEARRRSAAAVTLYRWP